MGAVGCIFLPKCDEDDFVLQQMDVVWDDSPHRHRHVLLLGSYGRGCGLGIGYRKVETVVEYEMDLCCLQRKITFRLDSFAPDGKII